MTDIHCHLLPYVDDGAFDMDEALELLEQEAGQGVDTVCLTPHLRQDMFETPDSKLLTMFARLNQAAAENSIPIRLFLSREYYYDSQFRQLLRDNRVMPMAGKVLLVEFSYGSNWEDLLEAAQLVQEAGYRPMFAHVERYRVIQHDPGVIQTLLAQGVLIQVNADSILGRAGFREKKTARQLLKNRAVTVVASDAHDCRLRTPNLQKCRTYLERKFGRDYARELLETNPRSILSEE